MKAATMRQLLARWHQLYARNRILPNELVSQESPSPGQRLVLGDELANEIGMFQAKLRHQMKEIEGRRAALGQSVVDIRSFLLSGATPRKAQGFPDIFRVGSAHLQDVDLTVPVAFSLNERDHIAIRCNSSDAKSFACLNIGSLRVLLTSKIKSIRFALIDCASHGFTAKSLDIANGPWFSEFPPVFSADGVIKYLDILLAKVADIKTREIGSLHSDLHHRNKTGDPLVPITIVMIGGFPIGFESMEALKRLESLIASGAAAGVHVVATIFEDQFSRIDSDAIRHRASKVFPRYLCVDDGYTTLGVLGRCKVDFDVIDFPEESLEGALEQFRAAYLELPKPSKPQLSDIAIPRTEFHKGRSIDEISVPVGYLEGTRLPYNLRLVDTRTASYHTFIAGGTGSGKSNLVHLIVKQILAKYSQDEVELYLADFRPTGVEFDQYSGLNLPNIRAILYGYSYESATGLLALLKQEIGARSRKFKTAQAGNYESFRSKTQEVLPRCLLIIDEAWLPLADQRNSVSGGKGQPGFLEILNDLTRIGRAHGVHLLLVSHSLEASVNGVQLDVIYRQMANRILLKPKLDKPEERERARQFLGADIDQLKQSNRIGVAAVYKEATDGNSEINMVNVATNEQSNARAISALNDSDVAASAIRKTPWLIHPATRNSIRSVLGARTKLKGIAAQSIIIGEKTTSPDLASLSTVQANLHPGHVLVLGQETDAKQSVLANLLFGMIAHVRYTSSSSVDCYNLESVFEVGDAATRWIWTSKHISHEVDVQKVGHYKLAGAFAGITKYVLIGSCESLRFEPALAKDVLNRTVPSAVSEIVFGGSDSSARLVLQAANLDVMEMRLGGRLNLSKFSHIILLPDYDRQSMMRELGGIAHAQTISENYFQVIDKTRGIAEFVKQLSVPTREDYSWLEAK